MSIVSILGVATSTISNIENGAVKPLSDTVEQLAKALGVTADELTYESPKMIKLAKDRVHLKAKAAKTLGERIKIFREERRLTISQFAEMSSVSKSQLMNIENNEDVPYEKTLNRIANALHVRPSTLTYISEDEERIWFRAIHSQGDDREE